MCPASVKNEANRREPASSTKSPLHAFRPTEIDKVARRSLARLAKRQGDFDLACELWKDAFGNTRHGSDAYEQLAIYYEHKARDTEQARLGRDPTSLPKSRNGMCFTYISRYLEIQNDESLKMVIVQRLASGKSSPLLLVRISDTLEKWRVNSDTDRRSRNHGCQRTPTVYRCPPPP